MTGDKYKFLFTKINKTAGTSILEALRKNDLDKDYGHFAIWELDFTEIENYFKFTFVRNPWDRALSIYYAKYRAWLHVDVLAPERGGHHKHGPNQIESFNSWLKRLPDFQKVPLAHVSSSISGWLKFDGPQLDWITHKDKDTAYFVGKFENLQNDFNAICDKVGMPRQELPHSNLKPDRLTPGTKKKRHYSEYYDDEAREIVAKKYRRDIEAFGYEFEESG